MEEEPDLLLFAGDDIQVHHPVARAEQVKRLNVLLREARVPAPLGVYAVRGNVDGPGWERMFDGVEATARSETADAGNGGVVVTCLSMQDTRTGARCGLPDSAR
jgi:hypothetical protein